MLFYCEMDPWRQRFGEILINIQNCSFTKIHLKISSAKKRPFCPAGDELKLIIFGHCMALWSNVTLRILVDTGLGNGLLPIIGAKPLPGAETDVNLSLNRCSPKQIKSLQRTYTYGIFREYIRFHADPAPWAHWGLKNSKTFQTTFSNALSWVKIVVFGVKLP